MTKCTDPDKLGRMVREISAGGVVVRRGPEGWEMAAIEPQKEPPAAGETAKKRSQKVLLALPKGLVDPGEKPDQTAIREVREETGLIATPITKLTDIKYVYVRSWGRGAEGSGDSLENLEKQVRRDTQNNPQLWAAYAQKLVLLVLDDLGLPVLAGPVSPFARAAVKGAVQIVERRLEQGSLVPRSSA